ncbi:MAG: Ig-like domain-containing protein [Candidatus Nanopelagicales bacterium]
MGSRSRKPAAAVAHSGSSADTPVSASAVGPSIATRAASAAPALVRSPARRQAAAKVSGATAKTTAAATSTNPIAAMFFNSTPSMSWTANPGQGANGAVTGLLNGIDAEGDPLSYTVTSTPVNGTVAIGTDGSYTYTPSEALAYDGTFDSFTVTASDAGAGFHLHGLGGLLNLLTFGLLGLSGHNTTVSVPVNVAAWKKYNTAPTATYSLGSPDPTTGVVLGQIDATDAENDPLTYSATSAPTKGSVTFTADGGFTYTPTPDARHAAARDWVTEADLSDSFTVTISDGKGGDISGPITVAIGPKNAAPVAGAPTVGSPVGSAGVISGSVTAIDADSDTLTYGGSGTTAKGTVTIDPSTGAFTYTPNTGAHGMSATTDTFTITITDGYGGATPVAVSVPIAALVVGNSMVRYSFNYTDGSQYWTPEAKNALQYAADKIASYLVVSQPVTVTFDVTGYSSPGSTTLASAGSDIRGFTPGYYYSIVQNKLISGADSNFFLSDGLINVNFGHSWSFGDDVASEQYDFVSVMMHEMMHAYGFRSYLTDAGNNDGTQWSLFDSGIVDWNGSPVINGSYRFDPAFNANLSGGNGGLYFVGGHATSAYGGRLVPLYTPSVWEPGSSGSHLDDYTFSGNDPQLMEAMADSGPRMRYLSAIEQGILQDLGYTVSAPSWSSMIFIGFGFFIRRRKTK